MPGSTAPSNVPIATSKALRVSSSSDVGLGDQCVPVAGIDIGADLAGRIGAVIAERDDLLLQPHLEPAERHRFSGREFQLEIVEPPAEHVAVRELMGEGVDRLRCARRPCR